MLTPISSLPSLRFFLLLAGLSFATPCLVACGGSSSQQDCEPAPAASLELPEDNPALLTAGEPTTISLVFDQTVTGVAAEDTVTLEGNGTIAIEGGPERYQVTFSELVAGEEVTLTVSPEGTASQIESECGALLAEPVSQTFTVDNGWSHIGEIEQNDTVVPNGPLFVEVTEDVGFTYPGPTGRAGLVDIDTDGLEDLVIYPVTVDEGANYTIQVYRRSIDAEGNPRFSPITDATGLTAAQATLWAFADIDNDGDQDAFSGSSSRSPDAQVGIWLNDGSGAFSYQGLSGLEGLVAGQSGETDVLKEMAAATFADFDGDGNLDLYIANHYSGSAAGDRFLPAPDELYKGDGAGSFSAVELPDQHNPLTSMAHPELAGTARAAYGIAPADYDNDGDIDIFVNNYGAGRPALDSPPLYIDHNFLWRNDGNMNFTDVGAETGVSATERGIGGVQMEEPVVFEGDNMPGPIGGNGFGCQWGDVDNDGDLDLIVGTIAHPDYPQSDRTMLHINQGEPGWSFTEESAERGLLYYEDELHPSLVDIDNDGKLDLAMSRLRGGSKLEMYLQREEGRFAIETQTRTGVDITRPGPTLWFDLEGDGDLDFFMPKGNDGRSGFIFRNEVGQINNSLSIRLVGATLPDATGARVRLTTSAGTQLRQVTSGEGHYGTQTNRTLTFGLGQDSGASDVTIIWPDGEEQSLGDVRANVSLLVTQGEGVELLQSN